LSLRVVVGVEAELLVLAVLEVLELGLLYQSAQELSIRLQLALGAQAKQAVQAAVQQEATLYFQP
jgi:hypothetical protein